ncbi:zf-C2H2 domain-containing protein [Rhizoctonia solani AG-1 IA]|uniref:Zf-C2H2 domain-containing protein n=1 Tax=Thanatephorus cucumeris (strain AG1-IA) TaxID=983506 RepID=L8X670_THACA|nr:zf-C2H2 domain-containing protein [Rhizoctonia solani AG-1 IA]
MAFASNWNFRWRYGLLAQPGAQAIEPFLGTRNSGLLEPLSHSQSCTVLTMVAIAFGLVESNVDTNDPDFEDDRLKTLPCYFAMFGLAEIFELVMGLDALKLRNIIQLIGICIFHAMLIVSAGLQIYQTRTALVLPDIDGRLVNPDNSCDGNGYKTCSGPDGLFALVEKFLIVVPVILGASLLSMIYFVRELYHEFGWAVFHAIGADPRMKGAAKMYRWYQIMICLLKFDFFCFVALTMQLLIVVLSKSSAEFGLTVAAIPVVLILLIGCGIAVQREIKWLMTGSLVLMLGAQAYFLYKFSRLFIGQTRKQYVSTRATLATVCGYFTVDTRGVAMLIIIPSYHCLCDDFCFLCRWAPMLCRFRQGLEEVQSASCGTTEPAARQGSFLPTPYSWTGPAWIIYRVLRLFAFNGNGHQPLQVDDIIGAESSIGPRVGCLTTTLYDEKRRDRAKDGFVTLAASGGIWFVSEVSCLFSGGVLLGGVNAQTTWLVRKTNSHAMRISEPLVHHPEEEELELRLEDVVNDDGESSDDIDGDHVGHPLDDHDGVHTLDVHSRSGEAPIEPHSDPSGAQQPFDHAALEAQIADLLTAEAARTTRRAAAAAAAARQFQRNTSARTNHPHSDPQSNPSTDPSSMSYPLSLAAAQSYPLPMQPIGYPPQGALPSEHDPADSNDGSGQHAANPSISSNPVVPGVLDGSAGHHGTQPQNFTDITDILAHLSAHLENAAAVVAAAGNSQPQGTMASSGAEDDDDSLHEGRDDDDDDDEPARPIVSAERPSGPEGEEDTTRPYVCDVPGCGKGFGRKSDLARRIHSGERPYPCDEPGCGKSFIQRSALNVHRRVHTGEKPHLCEYSGCDKTFGDSSSLARHRRTHTGRRPYKCDEPLCDKTFTRRTTLNRHMRVHIRPSKRRRTDEELTDIPAIGSFITPRAALPGGVRPVPQMSHSTMASLGSGNNPGASGSDVQLEGSSQQGSHHDSNPSSMPWPTEQPNAENQPHPAGSGAESRMPGVDGIGDGPGDYPEDWVRNMNGETEEDSEDLNAPSGAEASTSTESALRGIGNVGEKRCVPLQMPDVWNYFEYAVACVCTTSRRALVQSSGQSIQPLTIVYGVDLPLPHPTAIYQPSNPTPRTFARPVRSQRLTSIAGTPGSFSLPPRPATHLVPVPQALSVVARTCAQPRASGTSKPLTQTISPHGEVRGRIHINCS